MIGSEVRRTFGAVTPRWSGRVRRVLALGVGAAVLSLFGYVDSWLANGRDGGLNPQAWYTNDLAPGSE